MDALAKLFGWFKRWNDKNVVPENDMKVVRNGDVRTLTIKQDEITVYAISIALGEMVTRGTISSGVANKIEDRANELIDILSAGKMVVRDHDGIYREQELTSQTAKPVEDTKVLTLGDDDE